MEEPQVKLHGFWASPYVCKVIWALQLKNIKYEYIEENLSNKSPSLLLYNPVYKKVPVLVHGDKSVAESDVILQYIEETWSDRQTALLSSDPYERAMTRFWLNFGQQKGLTFFAFFLSSNENIEETTKQVVETLKTIQDQALGDKKFFGGDKIGLVDLSFGWLAHWFEPIQEVVGVQVLEPNTLPKLHQWIINFKQEPLINENLPDSKALLAHYERFKKRFTSLENI
ncbi:glutathione transferase gst 23 [Phtheirospermum japonicum]|uniref:Glutathione S-transferase n=1 Tax=Phtheirospermum japonicum TaxID=374723 RepID=A0A830CML8_9LAMI|nr:glutathione transferase gst 23 [Phtheirospermum japonicum]